MSVIVNEYLEQSTENLVLMTLAGRQRAYEALVLRYEQLLQFSQMERLQSRGFMIN